MSADVKFSADDLRNLAHVLDELTRITKETGVHFGVYGPVDVMVSGFTAKVRWDGNEETGRYVFEDRIGD